MPRVRANLPRVNIYPHASPSQCPRCDGGALHRHGEVRKRVKDIYVSEVVAMRYLCVGCGRSFTHYPQGVDRNGCSVRLRALMWVGIGAVAQVGGASADGAGMSGV